MTEKEINDKVGAMHFRFLDDEETSGAGWSGHQDARRIKRFETFW